MLLLEQVGLGFSVYPYLMEKDRLARAIATYVLFVTRMVTC